MNLSEETYRLIERYLNQELAPEEFQAFQQRLESDEAFRETVELEREVHRAIQLGGRDSLKQKLQGFEEDIVESETEAPQGNFRVVDGAESEHSPRKNRYSLWLALAASILLLVAPLTLFLVYSGGDSPEEIIQYAMAEAYPGGGFKGSGDALFQQALTAFKAEQYETADSLLNLLQVDPVKNSTLLLQGMVKLRMDQPGQAEPFLQEYAQNAPQADDRYWFLSISLYQQEKWGECRKTLEKVIRVDQDESHVEGAKTLLESLPDS